jgi:hypothetical protein
LAHGQTAADGFFSLPVQQIRSTTGQGTFICVSVTAPGYMPTYNAFGFPLSEPDLDIRTSLNPMTTAGTPLLTQSAQQTTESGLGTTFDPTRGVVGFATYDCQDNPAPQVYLSLSTNDPTITPAGGAVDAGPDGSLTVLAAGGRGIFLNVPPGSYKVTATPVGMGKPIETLSINVAANTLTAGAIVPSP